MSRITNTVQHDNGNVIIHFSRPVSIVRVNDDGLVLSDNTIISTYHEQDCYEDVYADWSNINGQGIVGQEASLIEFEIVTESGFNIILRNEGVGFIRYFVPCYNNQNGWYSDNLDLYVNNACFDIHGAVPEASD